MSRPRKSTRDAWLDQFADFHVDEQETCIELCEVIHRQSKRATGRKREQAAISAAEQGQPAARLPDGMAESEAIR